jgi:hypothetical protein
VSTFPTGSKRDDCAAATRRGWALRICTIAFVICGMLFRWWWPVVVLAALLLVIDAVYRLAEHLGADDD